MKMNSREFAMRQLGNSKIKSIYEEIVIEWISFIIIFYIYLKC